MNDSQVFALSDPLPQGTTVLEASAGTGKTFTIAALTARYIAEGHARLDEMLLVTFGRMATQELRERIRDQLIRAEAGLADPGRFADDPVVALLAGEQVELRRARLAAALSSFDEAMIATTHTFCHRMLAGLGISGDFDPSAELTEDILDLVDQVSTDQYLRRAAHTRMHLGLQTALEIGRQIPGLAGSRLVPEDEPPDSEDGQRLELAHAIGSALAWRKRHDRLLDFDDLQGLLCEALAHPVRGARVAELMRHRFTVVLVDEFQDTDPVQWQILRRAFHKQVPLILIADPKQAIYGFRGADVYTYLGVADQAGRRATLNVNYRCDQALLKGLDALLVGLALGDHRIKVDQVQARHPGSRILGDRPAVQLRVFDRQACSLGPRQLMDVQRMRLLIADDLAAEIVESLDSVLLAGGGAGPATSLRPSDIAVLVHTNAQGMLILDALRRAGVEAVLTSANSVFAAPAAGHWLALLAALDAPARQPLVRAAALTPFFGWTAGELATADEARLDRLTTTLRRWAEVAETRGMAALMAAATGGDLAARVLGVRDGERLLTDLRHVGESLHTVARERHLGLTGLLGWLRHRIDTAAKDSAGERSRRLASDLAAVQIVTVHRSKGLEFPVVFVPFAADRFVADKPFPVVMHEGVERIVDIGTSSSDGRAARLRRHRAEAAGEDLRLFYVAATRASSRLVLWWAPTRNTPASALNRVLFGAPDVEGMLPETIPVPSDGDLATRLAMLPDSIGVCLVRPGPVPAHTPPGTSVPDLRARTFARHLDRGWRRTSYTGLTAVVHDSGWQATSEPEDPGVDDETGDELEPPNSDEIGALRGSGILPQHGGDPHDPEREQRQRATLLISPMAGLPSGADFGTLVHAVLEKVDHHDPSPQALLDRCTAEIAHRGADIDAEELATAITAALSTPLGHALGGASLSQVRRTDRLTELTFELPLAGGDRPGARASLLADIADLLARRLPADDPLVGYPDLLRSPVLARQPLRGYLTGSLDAVLRHGEPGRSRYLVVDYKTNLLPRHTELPTAWDYRHEALTTAMMRSHYPLQALLYCVALHRYLRWRQPGYHPGSLDGAAYLFVRGMCGPHTPVIDGARTGVFSWRPDPGLIEELSALLAGRQR